MISHKLHRFFFALTLIFVPSQTGLHFWPNWTMVLGRRVDYLSPTIYLTDVLIFLTLLTWALFHRQKFLIVNLKTTIKRKNFQFLIFKTTLLIFVFLNIFFAKNQPVAIYKWLKILEFGLFGFYVYKTKPSLSLIASCFSLGIICSSLIAIAQFFTQGSLGGIFWWLGERTFNVNTPGIARITSCQALTVNCQLFLRPYATFPHPNVLGGFLAATLPLQLANLTNLTNLKKTIYGTSLTLGLATLILTFSRSATIMGLIALGIALPNIKHTNKTSNILKTLFIAVFFLGGLVFLFNLINLNEESVIVRQEFNFAAIKIWAQSPPIGVGLGNFLVKLPETIPTRTIYFLQPVHNIYLLLLSETGVVGLGIFGYLIWASLKNISKNNKFIYHLALIILLVLGLVDHYPLTLQQGQLLLTLLLALGTM